MSADSPRRAGMHKVAQVVSPQLISDKSIIDSMAGIINDIVPQAYTSSAPNSDNRESITWARFEYADVNDAVFFPDYNEGSSLPPLLLVLGYTTGVQVWLIAASGEATEVLSWRQGMVRTLRILPNPKNNDKERDDQFKLKRPMVAICDSAGPGPQFCNISFISLKTGEQVKNLKFKTPVYDIFANKRSIVVTFPERIAVFDSKTLDDVLTITTCYLSPGPNPNPVALGARWLAYSEKKLTPGRRSSGGSEGEGVSSYIATVLYAAKSLSKGLRGLGETVASSLTGNSVSPMTAVNNSNSTEAHPGIVTILDLQAAKEEKNDSNVETIVAHFAAHSDAIVAMTFDQTGALLMTADKRGHDFHVFRIQPHPGGPSLAAVHHLYVLHRGDTSAKVQDMSFSSDARWAAVSTVRGTTHVFPVAPYGGPVGVRTHSSPHVVNRLSRFHKSAGLTDNGTRSHSPVSHTEMPLSVYPYTNPRLPPYPHPTILHPLAQIRQPSSLNHSNSQVQTRTQQRQRLHSDDSITLPLKICACFAPPRAWIYAQRDSANKLTKRAADSLFIVACHGNMIQYDLEPKPAAGVPKEKVCDETSIELEVEAKGQWPLLRTTSSADILPPLPSSNPLLEISIVRSNEQHLNNNESRWLSQVEIFTHAGPHRRLWMGPQFVFKTYNAPSGVAANLVEAETVEVGIGAGSRPARSNPVNMPHTTSRPLLPVVIDGSGSSYEQSPRFVEAYGDALDHDHMGVIGCGENQLREDLAEAMLETSSTPQRNAGRRSVVERVGHPVAKVVNPVGTVITVSADEEPDVSLGQSTDQDDEGGCGDDGASSVLPTACPVGVSVCAQEGSWPQDDQVRECVELRDHTEICAEMRRAKEPAAIDSVPDDRIEELKERRSLCAEAASSLACCAVDLDRAGAFRDVPSSPSLCAERGAVPDCSNVLQQQQQQQQQQPRRRESAEAVDKSARELGYQLVEAHREEVGGDETSAAAATTATTTTCCPSSDDDLELITTEEIEEVTVVAQPPPPPTTTTTNRSAAAAAASSDDDIEHVVLYSEVPEVDKRRGAWGNGRKRSKEKQQQRNAPAAAAAPPAGKVKQVKCSVKEVEKPPAAEVVEVQQQSVGGAKKTRARPKRQSSVVNTCVGADSGEAIEIIDMDSVAEPLPLPLPTVQSIPLPAEIPAPDEKVDEEPTPITTSITSPETIEIVDVEAEKSVECFAKPLVPDCKILQFRPEYGKKKSKRHKKQQSAPSMPVAPPPAESSIQQEATDDLAEANEAPASEPVVDRSSVDKDVVEETQQSNNSAWSSIVSRSRSDSPCKVDTDECKPLSEDEDEANKENVDVSKFEIEKLGDEEETVPFQVEIANKWDDDVEEVVVEEMVSDKVVEEEVEKKSDSEQEVAIALVERSGSLDDVNAIIVPMDVEEESRSLFVTALIEKNLAINPAISLIPQTGGALPAKKANRSKKKKRR